MLALAVGQTPAAHDIPLPLPADRGLIVGVLIAMFLVHILFVNLMLGGALLTAFFQGRSLLGGSADDDRLAHEIAQTITVNKSLAVVLGVAPLLAINVVYTVYFYSANALTGTAWISIVPLAVVAFLLLYLHKYAWHAAIMERNRRLHYGILLAALAILLYIPVIFLTNINLMLVPDRWAEVRGFLSAAMVNYNVLPRYLHFLLASLALTGLFLVWHFSRRGVAVESLFQNLSRGDLKRRFYRLTAVATMIQLLAGLLVLFTLPSAGLSVALYVVIGAGATFALAGLVLLTREMKAPDALVGTRFKPVVVLLGVTVLCMGNGRHMVREKAIMAHSVAMEENTAAYLAARDTAFDAAQVAQAAGAGTLDGAALFKTTCASCHAPDRVLAAPPLTEVAETYKDNPEGIVAWAKKPGRKRTQFAPMPSMAHLGDERLAAIAQYVLEAVGESTGSAEPAASP